ncbi:hypothetical protein CTI12_AA086460 [Artemisia annua]|uniref:Uncharacterized protein n=1 Tax=Artemisia annua TaxID=35608 RepID=A0A2U1Q1E1_ARTAN|nr:hypothetical protein CTI12_AA086460 [Artemisia annua]
MFTFYSLTNAIIYSFIFLPLSSLSSFTVFTYIYNYVSLSMYTNIPYLYLKRSFSRKVSCRLAVMEKAKSGNSTNADTKNSEKRTEMRTQRVVPRRFEVIQEKTDIDKRADDFIKNFKNQLAMQRAESLKRYHEMINRGT